MYAIKDDILYKLEGRDKPSWKTYIPISLEDEIILNFHTGLGQSGVERVIFDIQEHLYTKRLANKVSKLVSQCTLCQRVKPINARYDVELQCTLRDKPWALVAVHCHGPLPASNFGNRHIFVLHDVFSEFVKLYPLKALSTRSCLSKIFDDYVPKYGPFEEY